MKNLTKIPSSLSEKMGTEGIQEDKPSTLSQMAVLSHRG